MEPLDLRCQLLDLLAVLEVKYAKKKVSVELEGPDEMLVEFDRSSLSICLERIIDNALKFSDDSGHVTIKYSVTNLSDDEWVTVRVRDRGCGIDPERLDYLYKALSLGCSAYDHTRGGGLSLAIVREIAWRHNGTIRLESAGEGHGCEATLGFPRRSTPERYYID